MAAVPREDYVTDMIFVPDEATGGMTELHRAREPERWREYVHGDHPVVTAVERVVGTESEFVPTVTSSAPHMMARMIDILDPRPGMRVLEVGTGTGYNAAVLAHIVGADHVTSVEVDPEAAGLARYALDRAGCAVTVVTGDGAAGYVPNAPYDRVIATAAVTAIPSPWARQTRSGGVILAPWGSAVGGTWLLCLTRAEDGSCVGRIETRSSSSRCVT
ncbi:methyltransferase domain-containing protein [Spiractinospora alimapuensis]|uniref:methyltransferase domain-containing protein n=1 Tax=Spiractinospora alimapuensis TaxID=2820884 RepID=UPI001F3D570F|nr:methyltransferase domain-containing protein [Spiractinospora alimapuensis]QVQ50230.1 methyltransferase domain-containing protein [Spiractinospora alimapuensis]